MFIIDPYSKIDSKKINHGYQKIIVILMLVLGLLNSSDYFNFMGVSILNKILSLLFYSLLSFMIFIIISSYLYKKKGSGVSSYPYWLILFIAVILKSIILIIQNPMSILPGGSNFSLLITIMSCLLLLIVLTKSIHSIYYLRTTIWSLGIGASFSGIIPLFYYPEMIGFRDALVNGYHFGGGFWNSGVISYISVGWLLIALLAGEKSRIKKIFLVSMFVLLALAGLSGLSRATLVSLIISIVVYLIMSNKFTQYLKVLMLTSILLIISFFVFQEAIDNFGKRLDSGNGVTDEERVVIWKDYIEDMPDYFIIGETEGNHKKYSKTGSGTHSILLNWLTQYGILGLLGFSILLLGVLKSIKNIRLKESKQTAAALYAWLAAYLSVSMMNETGFKELTVFAGIGIILVWGNLTRDIEMKNV